MAPEERRFTADEWRDIQGQYREQPKRGVRAMYPDPEAECELGPFVPSGGYRTPRAVEASSFTPHPHLVVWFASLSADDVLRLETLIALRPETVAWVSGKSPKELASMDGVVEFVSSSRTAAKVLMWVCGTTAAFIGGVIALTKGGFDLFKTIRGG